MILFCIFISSLLWAQEKVLKIAVSFYDPPFVTQIANNHFFGFDIAMMEDVCRIIGYTCQYIAVPTNQLIESVQTRKADLAISSIIITPERIKQANFSLPYLVSQAQVLGLKKFAEQSFDMNLLDRKKIGITDNVYMTLINMMGIEKPKITLFEQDDVMIQALRQGRIDFALVDAPTAHYWHINSSGALVALGEPMIFGSGMGIAINRNNFQLLGIINPALLEYQNSDAFKDDYHKFLIHFYTPGASPKDNNSHPH